VTAGAAGAGSSFDASASTVAYGTISSYTWNFGDGSFATTSTPSTTHTYAAAGSYTATLTETDSAGTSTAQVFTGQTMSRNGGPGAQTTRIVAVAPALAAIASVTTTAAPAPPKPPPAPGTPAAPTHVVISTSPVTITRRGDAVIEVNCPASATGGCRGTVTLKLAEPRARRARAVAARCARGCRPLGSAKYEARAGQNVRVRVHIASFGRRALASRKTLRVTVIATSTSGGRTTTNVATIRLRGRSHAA
jgi:hypothetical protein